MNLVWIGWRIEYPFGGVKGVCDDNYVIDVGDANCLVNTTSNGK